MNRIKRSVALLVAIILSVVMLPAANAATKDVTLYPGDERAVVTFTVEDIYSLDGSFSVEDPDGIVSDWSVRIADRGGMNGGNINGNVCYMYETANPAKARDVVLEATLKIKKSAAVGDTAKVTFDYIKGVEDSGMETKEVAETARVCVIVVPKEENNATTSTDPTNATNSTDPTNATNPSNTTEPDGTKDPTTSTTPTNPTAPTVNTGGDDKPVTNGNKPATNSGSNTTGKNNGNSTSTTTAPTEDDGEVNYDALQKEIKIAEGLTESDYEADVWAEFQELLEKAKDALDSDDQKEVDDLAKQLKEKNQAMAGLDTSKLVAAMDKVTEKSADTALSGLWYQMHDVLNNAQNLLDMGSGAAQSDVDKAVSDIEALLAEIDKENQAAAAEPGTMVEEVPVEVAPGDDYCNIGIHKLWPILFFVSLALNIAFAVIIIIYLVRKKKNQKDDTPLVDYDIDDDEFDDLDDELEAVE